MTQNEQNVTGTGSPQQVAADLFRIGENPTLPAWQYPVLQQAIGLLTPCVEQPAATPTNAKRPDAPGTWLWDTIQLARRAIRRSDADLADALEARLRDRFAAQFAVPSTDDLTYSSKQATTCAGCAQHKHTPLRVDWMGGYVCLTCIDRELERPVILAEDQRAAVEFALGACAGHIAGERHVSALESLLAGAREVR